MTLKIDFGFRKQFKTYKFSLNYCYQCGTCSGGCPVAKLTNGDYNPRKIIEACILGLKEKLTTLLEPNVWQCSTCQKCVEYCPQGVELTEIFDHVKNLCVEAGNYPQAYKAQGEAIREKGSAIPMSNAIIKRRERLGLPVMKTASHSEIQTLLRETGFIKKMESI
ncbi:MAG: hypothetical protein GF364_22495 [Candidatus Lokiarchaeota archaeon]|nr:hypothetical protein [Candidatus Lokiarchaeota archaeon]